MRQMEIKTIYRIKTKPPNIRKLKQRGMENEFATNSN